MIIIEIVMLTLMGSVSIASIYTDFKTGLIKNKLVLPAIGVSAILNILYYGLFARDLVGSFITNIIASTVLSVLLYCFHFWGAGDSKLLILIVSLFPARLYYGSLIPVPTLMIVVFTFSISFIYLVMEALFLGIKNRNLLQFSSGKPTLKKLWKIVYGYMASYAYIVLITVVETYVFRSYTITGSYIFTMLNFFCVLTVFGFDVLRKWYVIAVVTAIDIVLMIINGGISLKSFISIQTVLIVAVVMIFREIAEKYNYAEINTEDVKAGQILSLVTVLRFQTSRVKGLPLSTTEDFRSRITNEQAESIKRWKNSKSGQDKIIIVRKLPFAVFITIGAIVFFVVTRISV